MFVLPTMRPTKEESPLLYQIRSTMNTSQVWDEDGRFIKITGRIEGIEITLINFYLPPASYWTFYKRIFDLMVNSQGW